MENNKETKLKEGLAVRISEAFLKGTLFLLFGPKNWKKGKRPVPPVYVVGMVIVLLIFILIIKKATTKHQTFYQPKPYPHEGIKQRPLQPGRIPGGY